MWLINQISQVLLGSSKTPTQTSPKSVTSATVVVTEASSDDFDVPDFFQLHLPNIGGIDLQTVFFNSGLVPLDSYVMQPVSNIILDSFRPDGLIQDILAKVTYRNILKERSVKASKLGMGVTWE